MGVPKPRPSRILFRRSNMLESSWKKKLEWQKKNRKNNRPRYSKYHRDWRRQLRRDVLERLGGRCASTDCAWVNKDGSHGCTDWRCLQIDHVFGGGAKERKTYVGSKGQTWFYRKVMKDETGSYQLLCANCNWIKKYVNDESSGQTSS